MISVGSLNKYKSTKKREIKSKSKEKREIFDKDKCVIHLINVHSIADKLEDCESMGYLITEFITDQHPELWHMMKRGDLIEDLNVSGYRSQGRYIVDTEHSQQDHVKMIRNGLTIRDLYTEYDDYGTVYPNYYTITEFPIGYFDNIVTNNYLYPESKAESYWHSDPAIISVDKHKLKLDKLTADHVFTYECMEKLWNNIEKKVVYSYCVIRYKKCNYLIGIGTYYNNSSGEDAISNFIDVINENELFMCQYYSYDNYDKMGDAVKKIADKEKVEYNNILMLEES